MIELIFGPVTTETARDFVRWAYEPPYDIYNMVDDPQDEELVEEAVNYFLDPAINCRVIADENGRLLAFCTFGEDGQVPGGDYDRTALDIGLGVRPELTGQGLGRGFVTAVIRYAIQTFQPPALRVTIAEFNERARRVWAQQGLVTVQQFKATVGEKRPFIIMQKELS